jgi:hypothetical protein
MYHLDARTGGWNLQRDPPRRQGNRKTMPSSPDHLEVRVSRMVALHADCVCRADSSLFLDTASQPQEMPRRLLSRESLLTGNG